MPKTANYISKYIQNQNEIAAAAIAEYLVRRMIVAETEGTQYYAIRAD